MKVKIISEKTPYTQIPNALIEDIGLSDKNRFLYCCLRSESNDWTFVSRNISKKFGIAKRGVADGLRELRKAGWISCEFATDGFNSFCGLKISVHNEKKSCHNQLGNEPSSQKCHNGKIADTAKTVEHNNKELGSNNTKYSNNAPPSAPLGEDAGYATMMEIASRKEGRKNRPVAKPIEPVELIRPQWFLDYLAVFGVRPTDDKWIYKACMDAIALGAKPSELVECAKAHKKTVSSTQFMGSPQAFLANGTWAKYKKALKTAYVAPRLSFPNYAQLVEAGASEKVLGAFTSVNYDFLKKWWEKDVKNPTIPMFIKFIEDYFE